MRTLLLLCALAAAGCASWRRGPQPTWSNVPLTPADAQWSPATTDSAPSPSTPDAGTSAPESTYSTNRPVSPTPIDEPAQVVPQRPGAAPPALQAPPPGKPATAEPASTDAAPRIPNPNAARPPRAQVAGDAAHRPINTAAIADAAGPDWQPVGRSAAGRPIEMLQLGRGSKTLLLLGSFVGNERDSVAFVEQLAALLLREPQRLGDYSLVIVRTPNPDGYGDATSTNSRGVALNRNFPSGRFFGQRTAETGLQAASEPEVQTVLRLCEDLHPHRIVHVRAGQSSRPLVLANSAAVPGLRDRLDRSLLDGGEFEAYKAGSMEEFATDNLHVELLLLWLPGDASVWQNDLGRFATVLIGPATGSIRPASQSPVVTTVVVTPEVYPGADAAAAKADAPQASGPPDLFAPYESPATTAPGQWTAGTPRRPRGPVELLPPPPEHATSPHGHDAKFYALPPPPE